MLLAVSAGGGHGGPVASAYTGPNWVLGHWRAADPSCFLTEEVYTPTEYRKMVKGEDSWHHPYRVVYNVSAQEIWTHIDGGFWFKTTPVDANHIREDFGSSCGIYVRVP